MGREEGGREEREIEGGKRGIKKEVGRGREGEDENLIPLPFF